MSAAKSAMRRSLSSILRNRLAPRRPLAGKGARHFASFVPSASSSPTPRGGFEEFGLEAGSSSSSLSVPPRRFKESVGTVASRAADEGVHDAKFWADVCVELFHHLRRVSPRNIALVLNSLARIMLRDDALLDHVETTLSNAAWLRSFNSQDLALLCNCYARFGRDAPKLFELCAEELLWKLPDATSQELALVANAYAKLKAYDATLFRHVSALTLRRYEEMEPRHLANVLHAFARVDALATSTTVVERLARRISEPQAAAQLGAVGVAHACYAAGRAAARQPEHLQKGGVVRPLLEALARRLVELDRKHKLEHANFNDTCHAATSPVEARHVVALSRACLQAGAHSRKLASVLGAMLEARRQAAVSAQTSDGQNVDAGVVGRRRAVLMDVVDGSVALRESLDCFAAVSGNSAVEPEDCRPIEDTMSAALRDLAATADSEAERADERRRLMAWDRSLASWLAGEWSGNLRTALL